jgi:hypothetical protein
MRILLWLLLLGTCGALLWLAFRLLIALLTRD